ncbi:MAG: TIGR02757 family protein [Acidobacteria bacterium]|nr:TIGR02757 family protein [Acidobacteriota bacterium]
MRLRRHQLKELLEFLYAKYNAEFLHTDPLSLPHRYPDPLDREVVSFLSAVLAFGRADIIRDHLEALLGRMGPSPAAYLRRFDPREGERALQHFVHRWIRGRDLACLMHLLRQVLESHGSLKALFLEGFDPHEEHVGPALSRFVGRLLSQECSPFYRSGLLPPKARVRFFLPSPQDGSACKRLNLFLRWMVRQDSLDLGLWPEVPTSRLVVPLDVHVYRVSRALGLTRLKSPGWKMALQITRSLKRFDPEDPVKYDFSLCRLGMLKESCTGWNPSNLAQPVS